MPDSSKQAITSPLYIVGESFGPEQMLRHCLWKLLSETGFIHDSQLTEAESAVVSKLFRRKGVFGGKLIRSESEFEMALLNSAVDKIVCQIQTLQLDNQKSHSVVGNNHGPRKGANSEKRVSIRNNSSGSLPEISRSINDIGLTKRAARILQSMGIDTLGKLRTCSLSHLYKQERIGVKTIHDIETILSTFAAQASLDR